MRRAVVLVLAVAACDDDDGLVGRWDVELACGDGADEAAWPSCVTGARSVITLDDDAPPTGTHLTLFPGVPRADGGYDGTSGWVHGAWAGPVLELTLVGDADDPTASDGDRAAWRGRALVVRGTPASSAWDATWTFEDADGEGVAGTARVARSER